jgi:hypothetical protein
MKKLILTVCLALGLLIAPMAMADQVSTVGGYGPYQTGSGGEFTLLIVSGLSGVLDLYSGDPNRTKNYVQDGTFQTFCVENLEYVSKNTTYDAATSQTSVYTGKPLTLGAAWLYHQFQSGTLSGYDYATRTTAQALQNAIWYYMGVGADPNNAFTSLAEGQVDALANNNGQIPVAVLNLWAAGHLGEYDYRVQDMLVCVPEPGILILLGLAMSAIGIAVPFVRKI